MEVFMDCLPCILRQVMDASGMATDNKATQKTIMEEALGVLRRFGDYPNSPAIAREMHRIVKAHTGSADPYIEVKERDLRTALGLAPELRRRLTIKEDKLYWALKAAATGNVLDSAITASAGAHQLDAEFEIPFAVCDMAALADKLKTAKSLLVIGDNTGETVFDCLLLEELRHLRPVYAVRSAPVINDATEAEALASGVGEYASIVSTGCDVPGVLLAESADEFLEIFHNADIVISKGQGNYETLSDCPRDIFFLLKAKCPVIAKSLGVDLASYVFRYQEGGPAGR